MLSALGWFGGPTPVHRPLPGSPAIDRTIATANCPLVDQRGLPRPRDGGGSSAAVCDIGAVELAGVGEIFVEGFECGYLTPWSAVQRCWLSATGGLRPGVGRSRTATVRRSCCALSLRRSPLPERSREPEDTMKLAVHNE